MPPCHERGEVISPIFVCPKKDGSHRMILNLKRLNTYVEYHHFKMDTLWSVIKLITPNCLLMVFRVAHGSSQNYLSLFIQSWGKRAMSFRAILMMPTNRVTHMLIVSVMWWIQLFSALGLVVHPDKFGGFYSILLS